MGTKMKRYQDAIDSVGFASLNLINILNGKYILTDRTLPDIPIFELLLDGKQKVYLNKTAFPRAWIVHKTMTLPDVRDRLNYMRTFNPAEEAIVEEPVNIPPEAGGEAIITSYSPLKIEVKTNSPCQAFLVLSEIYYPPYWSAAIDGKKTKIYPTDHLLRGVVIPAGEHSVTFNCASVTYNLGKTVHYIVFAGILVVLIIYLRRTMKPLIRRV
jgi:hypothetical protein